MQSLTKYLALLFSLIFIFHTISYIIAKNRNMKDKTTIAIRKSVDEICDVCTCGGDQDDKCPDIIPGNLVGPKLIPHKLVI